MSPKFTKCCQLGTRQGGEDILKQQRKYLLVMNEKHLIIFSQLK